MTNAELNTFLDLEWNCAAFTPEEASVSAPLSPTQWARIISRHPELQEFCPFAEFTPADWVVVLEKQLPFAWRCSCWKDFTPHQWQRLLRRQPTLLHYGTSRLCSIIAKYRITPLCGVDCWRVTGPLKKRSIRVILRSATGSGPSSIIRARGFNVPAGNSSRNRCGGASCTAPPTCCRIARALTNSVTKTGVVLISFRN